MMNSTAIGITKPAGKLGSVQGHGKDEPSGTACVLVHPVGCRPQEVHYLLVVESDERGDSANHDERNVIPYSGMLSVFSKSAGRQLTKPFASKPEPPLSQSLPVESACPRKFRSFTWCWAGCSRTK